MQLPIVKLPAAVQISLALASSELKYESLSASKRSTRHCHFDSKNSLVDVPKVSQSISKFESKVR